MHPTRIAILRAARRTIFAVFCLGVVVEVVLLSVADPRQDMTGRREVGLFCGIGMLIWCLAFRKMEEGLASIGWLIAVLAIFLAGFVPARN
jgi:hypothetical protein